MKEQELVEKAMHATGLSQEKLAAKLGKSGASLSLFRRGKGSMGDEVYVELAEMAGLDPMQVLIERHAAKAGPKSKAIWKKIGNHLHTAATVAGVAVVMAAGMAGIGEVKASSNQQVSGPTSSMMKPFNAVYYVK